MKEEDIDNKVEALRERYMDMRESAIAVHGKNADAVITTVVNNATTFMSLCSLMVSREDFEEEEFFQNVTKLLNMATSRTGETLCAILGMDAEASNACNRVCKMVVDEIIKM